MSLLLSSLIVTSAILHISSSSFLSSIDDYRRIDGGGPKPLKRHGTMLGTAMPMMEGGDDGEDRPPPLGADENLDCDAIIRECQCDGPQETGRPVAQQQQQTFGFDMSVREKEEYPGNPNPERGPARRRGRGY